MQATLNANQVKLLALIIESGNRGCLVYGRGQSETAKALQDRGLIRKVGTVQVVIMGELEERPTWVATESARAWFEGGAK